MLSGVDAKANVACPPGTATEAQTYTDPVLGISFKDTLSIVQCPTYTSGPNNGNPVPGTLVDLELTGNFFPFAQKQIDTDFNPSPLNIPAVSVYKLDKEGVSASTGLPVKVWFDQASLGFGALSPNDTVLKQIYSDAALTNLIGSIAVSGGGIQYTPISGMFSTIYIKDTYTPAAGGGIDNVINDFRNVPGPLPILGAGAAFGFSRKLRGRIKAARTA